MRVLACILLCGAARADEMTGAIYVSRHGVRSPYPPGGTGWPAHGQSWEAWTSAPVKLSLIHISEPTRPERISYAVFCLKKKK